jgi:hypothetical protein
MDEHPRRHLVTFGAVLLIVGGAFNVLDGVTALAKPEQFHDDLLFSTLTAWGWFFAVYGVIEALIGIAVLRGSMIAIWPGIVAAGFNAFTQMAAIAHYPLWSITIMVVDVLVIYAFAVQGLEMGVVEVQEERDASAGTEHVLTTHG